LPASLDRGHSGWNWDEGRRAFDIYATGEACCRSLLGQIEQDVEGYAGEPARVAGVELPRPIGPWKPVRFLTVPAGFHAVLKVELLGGLAESG
jgi:hypothetical protein